LSTNACENINNEEAAIPVYFNNIRIVAYNVYKSEAEEQKKHSAQMAEMSRIPKLWNVLHRHQQSHEQITEERRRVALTVVPECDNCFAHSTNDWDKQLRRGTLIFDIVAC